MIRLPVIEEVVARGAPEVVVMQTTVMSLMISPQSAGCTHCLRVRIFCVVCCRRSYKEHTCNGISRDDLSIQFAISSLKRQLTSSFGCWVQLKLLCSDWLYHSWFKTVSSFLLLHGIRHRNCDVNSKIVFFHTIKSLMRFGPIIDYVCSYCQQTGWREKET